MLKSLHQVHQKIVEREQTLGSILEGLRTGYNPNYQDMAVLEAVRGWEALKGEGGEQHADGDTEVAEEQGQVVQKQDDHLSAREISEQIQALLSTDFYLLLLDHEKHINAPSDSTSTWCKTVIKFKTLTFI
jgi:protein kinase C substrate 80K-H